MSLFKGKVAIVGIGEVPSGKFPERPCLQNALEACKDAILDSGIDKEEIDTIIPTGTFLIGAITQIWSSQNLSRS